MMDRIQSITGALEIIGAARVAVYGKSPAAWEYLWHVTRYLTEQQMEAFKEVCSPECDLSSLPVCVGKAGGSTVESEGFSALARAVDGPDKASRAGEETESQFDTAVGSKRVI
jgi:hypothetical protein